MFTSFEFANFRGFEKLKLDGLKRVNLIVGRNNAGKTSLLEGITLISDPREFGKLPKLYRPHAGNVGKRYFRWILRDTPGVDVSALYSSTPTEDRMVIFDGRKERKKSPSQEVNYVGETPGYRIWSSASKALTCRVIPVQHHSPETLVNLFAAAVKRKGGEEQIESLLRQVDSRIVKVRIEPSDDGNHVLVDLGLSEMLPVSQVGQGIYRLIAIFSELIGDRPNICIVDEIENGIHHSMLEQVWAGLALAAYNLDIQIFATTHSEECIEAAHEAFSKRLAYDFSIIQLFRVDGAVQGKVLNREHIEAAMAGEIDLR